ncbi:hypothetical protein AHAS_Ahas11G0312600 [Arachis hypogaea]
MCDRALHSPLSLVIAQDPSTLRRRSDTTTVASRSALATQQQWQCGRLLAFLRSVAAASVAFLRSHRFLPPFAAPSPSVQFQSRNSLKNRKPNQSAPQTPLVSG